jgi:1-phosphofructokinase family hexose kinase
LAARSVRDAEVAGSNPAFPTMSRIVIACPNFSFDRTMTVEEIEIGKIHRSSNTDARGGGKGVNVARALDCIGVSSLVVGILGGFTGEAVKGLLDKEGVNARGIMVPGETRSCLTVIGPDSITVFNEAGPELSEQDWARFEAILREHLAEADVFVCSGSFPPGTPFDAAARMIELAKDRDCITVCDTSRMYLDVALEAKPDIIKPNLAEALGVLSGHTEETAEGDPDASRRAEDAAFALLDRGPAAVLVSAGRAGAVLATSEGSTCFSSPKIKLVNSIGAGDCIVAGVAYELSAVHPLEVAITRGIAMAAASCETVAAGNFDPMRAEELLTAVTRRSGPC